MGDEAGTRGRIVAAALGLFCRRGYAAVGTQELCAAAGVNKGTLYHFFPGKLEVALAALRQYGDGVRAEYARLAGTRAAPRRKLAGVFALSRAAAEASRAGTGAVTGCLHGNLAQELAAADPRVRAVLAEVTAGWAAELAPVAAALLGVPASGKRATAAAHALLAYLHGAVLAAKVANDPAVITTLGKAAGGLLAATAPAATR